MFKSYFKLALRNLWKRKTTTFINVFGLAIGLACCALVFLFVQHEFSFDKGFDNAANIYRVTTTFKDGSAAPTTVMPYATYLKSEVPEIKQVSRLDASKCTCVIQVNDGNDHTPYTVDNGYWADPSFFDIFYFHFSQGNRATAFSSPNAIVLSEPLAQKLFGNGLAVGRTIKTDNNIYTVTGVFKKDFLNHINADFFASNNSNGVREKIAAVHNWVVDPNYYCYVSLKPGSNKQHVINELKAYIQNHAAADMKATNDKVSSSLQLLTDIHLHSSQYQSYMEVKQGNLKYLYLLGSIALTILLLGCINYMNLSTAQAIDRAREVGVRRVMGADRSAIRYQFLMETVAISLMALVLAILLAFLLLPVFNMMTGQELSFFAPENNTLILWMLLITLTTGLLAGIYPAWYLSAFNPVKVLKGKASDSLSLINIRTILVSMQFIISTCLIFGTLVIWKQLNFMINAKPGFDQDQQLVINLNTDQARNNIAYYRDQLANNPNFQEVSAAASGLISGDMNMYAQGKTVNDKHEVFLNLVDDHYLKTVGIKLISGTNFTPVSFTNKNTALDLEATDIGRQVIINEEAAKALGLNPYTAPGNYLSRFYNGVVYNYKIMGVMKDYHFFSLHSAIGACMIMPANPIRFSTIIAKVKGNDMTAAIKYSQQVWKTLNPDTPFTYGFLNDSFTWDYIQDQREQQMMAICAVIAILISGLGLLGLITYSLNQRAREIGIRKVIGASVSNIVMLFYKQYFKLVLIANAIALPLAWFYMSRYWLTGFFYRTDIGWLTFVISLSAGVVVAFFTIAIKTIGAAVANPVISLRGE
ncbi:ABC transporter permease [Mucilaginibacter sp. E4BP6]|uniref:ABC transporter permease n=1 Tax=Mucilaginibacter sp. E4BP6 TaxID=2723089 RepID=UPI0015CD6ADC|nr:ABC transporter permease [Mucilaginibacter sp. E4BP6]NYE68468.1 putative ABC transport system permease protein [Mucilaginibacter sp. E4BP6]